MSKLILVGMAVLLSSCASTQLMRCPEKAPDKFMICPKAMKGDYRMCQEGDEVYSCEEPK